MSDEWADASKELLEPETLVLAAYKRFGEVVYDLAKVKGATWYRVKPVEVLINVDYWTYLPRLPQGYE